MSGTDLYVLYFWHPMQDADAECRMQKRAQSCELVPDAGCRMQDAKCRSGPKATAVRDVQDAGCRMQNAKLTHSQERADRVPMQDAGAECKNSPNIGRRGQKKSRTECTMQVRNAESHPRVHCVCREGLVWCRCSLCRLQPACYMSRCTARSALGAERGTRL